MRLLFTTTPGFSHTTPLFPLAHAARMSGHRVLFATSGPARRAAQHAGLPTTDPAPDQDVIRPYLDLANHAVEEDMSHEKTMRTVFGAFSEMSLMMMDGVVATARQWGADAIVYTPMLSSGPVAARSAGATAVLHSIGLRHPAFPAQPDLVDAAARRHGVDSAALGADVELAIAPDSLERVSSAGADVGSAVPLLDMRPCPDNSGGEVPDWALDRGGRPRVLVTLGSVPTHTDGWQGLITEALAGLADLDVEVVFTTGGADLDSLGSLPPWVRVVNFVPLTSLLPECDAVVHHGGMGTMFSALAAGIPQVIIPTTNGDALLNGEVVEKRGTGLRMLPDAVSAASLTHAVREVLDTPGYRATSEEVAAEMAAMPHPETVPARLAALGA